MDVIPLKFGADEEPRRKSRLTPAVSRSLALEQAYVHDVYEMCNEVVSPVRPRITQFLTSLEPGSLVCDVGCGNGRYLTPPNSLVHSIGIDRCNRLSQLARARGNDVAICDNTDLPFRSESFDAALSLAVVHHFASKERRVDALREIARILRIGGKAVITVWALEQRNRRFESQDILIPWELSSTTSASDDDDDEDFLPPYSAYSEDSTTNSSKSIGDGDSSSLSSSSPVETCCIFVRRAIQKLTSSKKHTWILDTINAKDNKMTTGWDVEDAKNLPIELRRLEDFDDIPEPAPPFRLDPRAEVVSSQCPPEPSPSPSPPITTTRILTKQASMNEDLMPETRQRDRDGVRKKIQKQASLNESFLCRSLSKRLQLFGHGLGGALKSSTEGLERATKTGFGRIMKTMSTNGRHELMTRSSAGSTLLHTPSDEADAPPTPASQSIPEVAEIPLSRHTHESGSDSSKESSLQSDTSVESEDSFASVIYVPSAGEQKVDPSPPPTQSPASNFILPEVSTTPSPSPTAKTPTTRTFPPMSPVPSFSRKPPLMPFICEERRSSSTRSEDGESKRLISDRVLVKSKPDARSRMKAYFNSRTTSLDIYHPETDDLESDSTEPSSPDSVDSVISALKLDEAICLSKEVISDEKEKPQPEIIPELPQKISEKNEEPEEKLECRQLLEDYAEKLSTKLLEDVNGRLAAVRNTTTEVVKSPPAPRLSPREFTLPLNTGLNGISGPQSSESVMNRSKIAAVRPVTKMACNTGAGCSMGAKAKISSTSVPKVSLMLDLKAEPAEGGKSSSRQEPDAASVGGSATLHRFYHVFREGELETLINHHVTSLHVVQSYYERASWCVVAEKVQVWTI
ncbi:hypothetical protein DMENIID0001_058980 [Sergentomyia squamirostris]